MLQTLQHFVSNPKEEILLFDESQHPLFLTYALPLLASGYSVGPITLGIIKSLNLEVERTDSEGVFTCSHPVAQPSILCFSSGTKNHQKGIIDGFRRRCWLDQTGGLKSNRGYFVGRRGRRRRRNFLRRRERLLILAIVSDIQRGHLWNFGLW
jgi:hypothetical protein